MKRVIVLTPPDARFGFALTGVMQLIPDPVELPQRLGALARDAQTGIVILDERLATPAAQARIRELDRQWPGLVVLLPAPGKPARAEDDYVLRLIRRAIGYQLRLGP